MTPSAAHFRDGEVLLVQTTDLSIPFSDSTYASGEQKSGAVGGGIIGEPDLDAVPRQLVAVSCGDDLVALEAGIRYLAADVLVGGADDHAVLRGVVFVLVLNHQALAGEVVGLALAPPAELDLEPLEVGLVLHKLDERLQ